MKLGVSELDVLSHLSRANNWSVIANSYFLASLICHMTAEKSHGDMNSYGIHIIFLHFDVIVSMLYLFVEHKINV